MNHARSAWERAANGLDGDPTHIAVDHDPDETDPDNGALALESPDEARLARAVACVNFLAGVPDDVLTGQGIDDTLLGLLRAMLRNPADCGARGALADRLIEPGADRTAYSDTPVISMADRVASATPGSGTPSPVGLENASPVLTPTVPAGAA